MTTGRKGSELGTEYPLCSAVDFWMGLSIGSWSEERSVPTGDSFTLGHELYAQCQALEMNGTKDLIQGHLQNLDNCCFCFSTVAITRAIP